MSLLLQVEQEKQFTHQALLRADTTVMGRWAGLRRPSQAPAGPAVQSQGQQGGWEWRSRATQGQERLTITLDHVAAAVADVPKELWTKQGSNTQAVVSQPRARAVAWPHPKWQLSASTYTSWASCQGTASGLR